MARRARRPQLVPGERLTLAPVRSSPDFIQITITLGVAVVLRGIALIAFGKDPLSMPGFSGDGVLEVAGAAVPVQSLWVWGATALMLVAMFAPIRAAPCAPVPSTCRRHA